MKQLAAIDTGKKIKKTRKRHDNLVCKKILNDEFEKFKSELFILCNKYNLQIKNSREWDKQKSITYIPTIVTMKISYGKLKKQIFIENDKKVRFEKGDKIELEE